MDAKDIFCLVNIWKGEKRELKFAINGACIMIDF